MVSSLSTDHKHTILIAQPPEPADQIPPLILLATIIQHTSFPLTCTSMHHAMLPLLLCAQYAQMHWFVSVRI